MKVFATVGSTKFDELVAAVDGDQIREILAKRGYVSVTVQYGMGSYKIREDSGAKGVTLAAYNFKPSLDEDMEQADLVISHAGAGSIMEALRRRKKLIVVVNERLMHNHQAELANEMDARGHSFAATVSTLADVLASADFSSRVELPAADRTVVPRILREELLF
mmetsp:Transcript_6045/g.18239  ORF Transcript_6045/g.18239 Transcript_6045/m.18239 type:complete len:164 (-) Transcript_6045:932-1423(-)